MLKVFSQLVGHSPVKNLLSRMLVDRSLPPVSLFYGPAGVGKTFFAQVLARELLATTKKDPADIHILSPEGKSYHHPVEAIKELIVELGLPPFESSHKVFIIEEAERMLPSSSNALLKALEEPPSDTYFILTSSDHSKLLPTILSRCCKIQFFPIPETEITDYLIKNLNLSLEESKKMALLSEGSLGKALFMVRHPHKQALELVFQAPDYPCLMESLSQLDDTLEISEDDESLRIKQVDVIFEEILYWIRDKKPLMLEKAFLIISEARTAFTHHIKLKTILENLFLHLNNLKN